MLETIMEPQKFLSSYTGENTCKIRARDLCRASPLRAKMSENHRLKAVAGVTDCKSCSGQKPAKCTPHQAGFKK